MKYNYTHTTIPEISTDYFSDGNIIIKSYEEASPSYQFDIALLAYEIALRLGIKSVVSNDFKDLPYCQSNDHLLYECPNLSYTLNQNIYFLRGWQQFESCIKGFNSLGLLAEQVHLVLHELRALPVSGLNSIKKEFLSTRKKEGKLVFSKEEIESLTDKELLAIHFLDLAIWKAFAHKTIVCSTSSNMGISIHQGLRYMQQAAIKLSDKSITLLNDDEGSLIIWCPDEEADFMNAEKTHMLRSIEAEQPKLTTLRTYINRQQRDPGALKDAMVLGGYFFPTNPQSKDEIQNLLFIAANDVMKERDGTFQELIQDAKVQEVLKSLKCTLEKGKINIHSGVEGGIYGLMLPYIILIEEFLSQKKKYKALSIWNQASIGAALAAAVKADTVFREIHCINDKTRSKLNSLFPKISRFLDNKRVGKDIKTSIHGLFDLANLQSLAQLLGVVVDKHLSGRGTAYVGLGSSSYSNGNKCYDILNESMEKGYSFNGKATFHPATHTLNPFAQALVFGEDMLRYVDKHQLHKGKISDTDLTNILQHAKKPEPAGAAAMAGYMLTRLDKKTLSVVEIALMLKLMGFTKNLFLEFINLPANDQGLNKFFQEAQEEGRYMAELAKDILLMLDWSAQELLERNKLEKAHSILRYKLVPLDFENIPEKEVCIYLTGDNTTQPSIELVEQLTANAQKYTELRVHTVFNESRSLKSEVNSNMINVVSNFFNFVSSSFQNIEKKSNRWKNKAISRIIERKAQHIYQKHHENI